MKKIFLFLLLCVVMITTSSCGLLDDRESKSKILSFVIDHQEELTECINSGDFSSLDSYRIIHDVSVQENDFFRNVEFDCGGAGMGGETAYRGFFWSPENDMTAIWCAPTGTLHPSGDGYAWKEGSGDNTFYVEQICENFFYYEAEF